MSHQVEDTAFVIAHYRAQDPTFSLDNYAHLWQNKGAYEIAQKFAEQVSEFDNILHCGRNRIIFNYLQKYTALEKDILIINIGAGFSMYPYTLPEKLRHFEIDLPHVVAYKVKETEKFIRTQKLPERQVTHASFDITKKSDLESLFTEVSLDASNQRIVVMEGLFFFLPIPKIEQLLSFCRRYLNKGDIILCESYKKDIEHTGVYKKLLQFFGADFKLRSTAHGNFPHSFYEQVEGFDVLEKSSSYDICLKNKKIPASVEEKEVLNEYVYVLERR
ncbi:class I SAM-dependent methyltransferase [Marinirhabdus gelatinilytica]|uniref:Leucine carboxyl methyltransferase n=1 Tax=Marinirhabdus gelatinilytica TaxID=1703343 RepID=A0A370Q3P9_9FLAO|nr:class I SAM-dependent methyltransferase [Marinirhabdus gelatinilytica]RDK82993.1 leucine carboxyl methyltransferase [Marinirhabdus gelatinilytica]